MLLHNNESTDHPNRRRRLSRYAPVLFWIGVIFYLSGGGGSFNETSRYVRPLLEFLFPTADVETLQLYHGYIRKLAHVAVYAVLGILAARAFTTSQMHTLRTRWPIAVLALVIAIALIDEFQQSFNDARTGAVGDVALDTLGGILAVAAFIILRKLWRRIRPARPPQ
ncbi:MAG: VanZ family protein [Blastocatellia bacterium]|nr:VanZ family protein [Blastocatellia bacterium]